MSTSPRKHKKLPLPFRPRLEILEDRTLLSVCTVDRRTDLGQGTGLTGDLRYCISQAQDQDSIAFTVTGAINLTRALPDLTHGIGIVGPGADLLTVRRSTGPGGNRKFFVVTVMAVQLEGPEPAPLTNRASNPPMILSFTTKLGQ